MNVTETSAEGLKREFKITIPANEVEDKITKRLDEVGRMVRIPGFPPGQGAAAAAAQTLRRGRARRGSGERGTGQLGRGDSRAQSAPGAAAAL